MAYFIGNNTDLNFSSHEKIINNHNKNNKQGKRKKEKDLPHSVTCLVWHEPPLAEKTNICSIYHCFKRSRVVKPFLQCTISYIPSSISSIYDEIRTNSHYKSFLLEISGSLTLFLSLQLRMQPTWQNSQFQQDQDQ